MGQEFFSKIDNLYLKKETIDLKEVAPMIFNINGVLSMDENLLPVLAYFNRYLFTLKERYYTLLDRFIPKMLGKPRVPYINIKKDKSNIDADACKRISQMYVISNREAYQYLQLLKLQIGDKIYTELGIEIKGE